MWCLAQLLASQRQGKRLAGGPVAAVEYYVVSRTVEILLENDV